MELITSKLLPVPHGFPTRADGLNTSGALADSPQGIERVLVELAGAAKVERSRLFGVRQVHGVRVVEAPATEAVEADAIWSGRSGDAVGVKTADCLPLLLVDPRGRRVAAVHAGWRGTFHQIARATVEALAQAGTRPADLRVAIGPSIRVCCYQVGEELASQFLSRFPPEVCQRREGRAYLDLQRAVQSTLAHCGVPVGQIDDLGFCSSCDGRFYSHRRDRGLTGRHFSFVACHF